MGVSLGDVLVEGLPLVSGGELGMGFFGECMGLVRRRCRPGGGGLGCLGRNGGGGFAWVAGLRWEQ